MSPTLCWLRFEGSRSADTPLPNPCVDFATKLKVLPSQATCHLNLSTHVQQTSSDLSHHLADAAASSFRLRVGDTSLEERGLPDQTLSCHVALISLPWLTYVIKTYKPGSSRTFLLSHRTNFSAAFEPFCVLGPSFSSVLPIILLRSQEPRGIRISGEESRY